MKTTKSLFCLVLAILAPTSLQAEQAANDVLFSCQTSQGKQVRIDLSGDNVRYRFGRQLQQPEITLSLNRNQVYGNYLRPILDDGSRATLLEIHLPNRQYTYVVYGNDLHGQAQYSIEIKKNRQTIATLTCRHASAVFNLDLFQQLPQLPESILI